MTCIASAILLALIANMIPAEPDQWLELALQQWFQQVDIFALPENDRVRVLSVLAENASHKITFLCQHTLLGTDGAFVHGDGQGAAHQQTAGIH
jgi:hypothetical protein